jgi:hypothetical protein
MPCKTIHRPGTGRWITLITGPFPPNVVMGVDFKGSRLLAGDSLRDGAA